MNQPPNERIMTGMNSLMWAVVLALLGYVRWGPEDYTDATARLGWGLAETALLGFFPSAFVFALIAARLVRRGSSGPGLAPGDSRLIVGAVLNISATIGLVGVGVLAWMITRSA